MPKRDTLWEQLLLNYGLNVNSKGMTLGKTLAGHHHIDPDAGDTHVFWAVVINPGLTIAQIIGGVLSGSLALLADALPNFSDAISLIIAFAARKIGRRPADEAMTFGYEAAGQADKPHHDVDHEQT